METTDFKDLAAPSAFIRPFIQEGRYACYENPACEFDDEDDDEDNGAKNGQVLGGVRHVVTDGYEGDGDNDSDDYGDSYDGGPYAYHDLYSEDQDGDGDADAGAANDHDNYAAMYGDFSVQELHEFMLQQQQQSMLDYAYSLRRYSLLETIHEETLEELKSDSECRSEVSDGYSGVWCWGDDFTDGAESVIYVENPQGDHGCSHVLACSILEPSKDDSGEDAPEPRTNSKPRGEVIQVIADKSTDPSDKEGTWLDAEADDASRASNGQHSPLAPQWSVVRGTVDQTATANSSTVLTESGVAWQTTVIEQSGTATQDVPRATDTFAVGDSMEDQTSRRMSTPPAPVASEDIDQQCTTVVESDMLLVIDDEVAVESHHQHMAGRTPSTSSPPSLQNHRELGNHDHYQTQSSEFLSWSDAIDAYLMSLAVDQQSPLPEVAQFKEDTSATGGNDQFLVTRTGDPVQSQLQPPHHAVTASLVDHCDPENQPDECGLLQMVAQPYGAPTGVRLQDESWDTTMLSSMPPHWRGAGVGSETVVSNSNIGDIIRQVEGKSCQGSNILGRDLHPFDLRRVEVTSRPSLSSWSATAEEDGGDACVRATIPVRESSSSFLDEDESLVEFVGLENLVRTAGDGAEEQELLRACTKFLNGDHQRRNYDDDPVPVAYCDVDDPFFNKQLLQQQHRLSGIKSAPDLHDLGDDHDDGGHCEECHLLANDHFSSLRLSLSSMEDYAQKSQSEPCVHVGQIRDSDAEPEVDVRGRGAGSRAKFSAFGVSSDYFCSSSTPLKRHSYSYGLSNDLSSSGQLDHGPYSKSFDSQFSNDIYRHGGSSSSDNGCGSSDEEVEEDEVSSVNSYDGQGDGSVRLSRSRASLSLFPRFTPPGALRSFRSFDTLHLAGKDDDQGVGGESARSLSGHLTTGHSWMDGIDEECSSEREEKARPSSENLSEDSGFCDLRKTTPHNTPLLWSESDDSAFHAQTSIFSVVNLSKTEVTQEIYTVTLEDPVGYSNVDNLDQKCSQPFSPLGTVDTGLDNQDSPKDLVPLQWLDGDLKSVYVNETTVIGHCIASGEELETGSDCGAILKPFSCAESSQVGVQTKEADEPQWNSPHPPDPSGPLSSTSCLFQTEQYQIRGDRLPQTTNDSQPPEEGRTTDVRDQPHSMQQEDGQVVLGSSVLQEPPQEPVPAPTRVSELGVPVLETYVGSTTTPPPMRLHFLAGGGSERGHAVPRGGVAAGETIVLAICEGHPMGDAPTGGNAESDESDLESALEIPRKSRSDQISSDGGSDALSDSLDAPKAMLQFQDDPEARQQQRIGGVLQPTHKGTSLSVTTTSVDIEGDYEAHIRSTVTLNRLSEVDGTSAARQHAKSITKQSGDLTIESTLETDRCRTKVDLQTSTCAVSDYVYVLQSNVSIDSDVGAGKDIDDDDDDVDTNQDFVRTNLTLNYDRDRSDTTVVINADNDGEHCGVANGSTTTTTIETSDGGLEVKVEVRRSEPEDEEKDDEEEEEEEFASPDRERLNFVRARKLGVFGAARQPEGWARLTPETAEEASSSTESEQQGGVPLSDELLQGTESTVFCGDLIRTETPTTPPRLTTATTAAVEATAAASTPPPPKTEARLEATPFGTGRLVRTHEVEVVVEEKEEEGVGVRRRWQRRRSSTTDFVDQKSLLSSDEEEPEEEEESSSSAASASQEEKEKGAALNSRLSTVYSAFTHDLPERSAKRTGPDKEEQSCASSESEETEASEEEEEKKERTILVCTSGKGHTDAAQSGSDSTGSPHHYQKSPARFGTSPNAEGGEYQTRDSLSESLLESSSGAELLSRNDSGEPRAKQRRVVTFLEDPEMGEKSETARRQLWWPYAPLVKSSSVGQGRYATGKPTDITTWTDQGPSLVLLSDRCHGDVRRRPECAGALVWEDQDEWFGSSIDSDPDDGGDVTDGGDLQPRSAALVAKIVGAPCTASTSTGDNSDVIGGSRVATAARDYVTPGKPPLPPRHQTAVGASPRQVATCRAKIINARQHFFTRRKQGQAQASTSSDDNDDDESTAEGSVRSVSEDSGDGSAPQQQHHADVAEVLERFRQRAQEGRERIAKTVLDLSEVERTVRIQQRQQQQQQQSVVPRGIDPYRGDDESELVEEIRSGRGRYGWGSGNGTGGCYEDDDVDDADRNQSPSISKPLRVNGSDGDEYKNGFGGDDHNIEDYDDDPPVQSPFSERFQDVYRHVAADRQSSVSCQEQQRWLDSSDSDAPLQHLRSSSSGHPRHQPYHDNRPASPPEEARLLGGSGSSSSSPPATVDARRRNPAQYYGRAPAGGRRRSSATSWRGSNQSIGYLETDIDTLHSREVICVPDGADVDDTDANASWNGFYGLGSTRRHYPFKLKTQSMFNLTATDVTGRNPTAGSPLGQVAGGGDLEIGDADDSSSRAKSMEFLLKDENKAAILPPENRLQQQQQQQTGGGGSPDVHLRTPLQGERVLSEHELRIRRSLQKLDLPEWYTSSPISQMGSTEGLILKKDRKSSDRASMPRWEDFRSRSSTLLGGGSATRSSTPASMTSSSSRNVVISKRVTTPDFRYVKSSRESLLQSPMSPTPSPSPKDKSNYFQYYGGSHTPSSVLSRWSSSRFSSTTASSRSTSPTGSLQYRSGFQRQPYLGWRSSERLAREMTNSAPTAAGDSVNSTPTHNAFYRSAAERLSQGPGYYAFRFGMYRAPGSDTNLAHRDGRRGSDISTATTPPCAMHSGSGDSATSPVTTALVVGEGDAYDGGGYKRPEITVNVIEPNGHHGGTGNRDGRSSSSSSEQMQVADLVREIDKLIHRNGQVVENGDVAALQQQQQQTVPRPGIATTSAAEQKSQEVPSGNEAQSSPKTGARQQMVWMESSFVGIRSIAPAATPTSEYPSAATTPTTTVADSGGSSRDATPKSRHDSDVTPVHDQSPGTAATTTSHVQVHPQPPTLFQTPSSHSQVTLKR